MIKLHPHILIYYKKMYYSLIYMMKYHPILNIYTHIYIFFKEKTKDRLF